MSEFIKVFKEFFSTLDWKLMTAAIVMIIIVLIVSYILFVALLSVYRRKKAVNVSLPELQTLGEDFSKNKPQFKPTDEGYEVELIDSDNDYLINKTKRDNYDKFLETLILETRQFIPLSVENPDLPEIGEFNFEEFKQEKIEEVIKKKEESIQHLREVAIADKTDDEITIIDELLLTTNEGE